MTENETDSSQTPNVPARPGEPTPMEESLPVTQRPGSDEPQPSGVSPASDDASVIEDAYSPESEGTEPPAEDDPDLLDPSTRSLDAAVTDTGEETADVVPATSAVVDADESGDADRISDDIDAPAEPAEPQIDRRLDHDVIAHRIAVQLKRVEVEVRELLEGGDSKRKRKLSGTRRWRELEEDIIGWRFSGRISEEALTRLQELVARRNYLFRRLVFVAGTRRRWNT